MNREGQDLVGEGVKTAKRAASDCVEFFTSE